tara:strand:+ start:37 stop:477 length:441 start_codon:yes stop_codon:yes gene_type:complete
MEHDLFIDGNVNEYTWSIKTDGNIAEQIREHPDAYLSGGKLDVKNDNESRFIAVHVGIYWGLGVYIIKDFDVVNIMCTSRQMYEIFTQKIKSDNQIINDKIYFINQLTKQRNLKINYKLIEQNDNLATRLLLLDKDSIGRDSRGYV